MAFMAPSFVEIAGTRAARRVTAASVTSRKSGEPASACDVRRDASVPLPARGLRQNEAWALVIALAIRWNRDPWRMGPVDFEVEQTAIGDGNTVLVSVYGELDLATCAELASVADELASTHRPVILDLSACPFIDSTGLRQVLELSDDDADAAA